MNGSLKAIIFAVFAVSVAFCIISEDTDAYTYDTVLENGGTVEVHPGSSFSVDFVSSSSITYFNFANVKIADSNGNTVSESGNYSYTASITKGGADITLTSDIAVGTYTVTVDFYKGTVCSSTVGTLIVTTDEIVDVPETTTRSITDERTTDVVKVGTRYTVIPGGNMMTTFGSIVSLTVSKDGTVLSDPWIKLYNPGSYNDGSVYSYIEGTPTAEDVGIYSCQITYKLGQGTNFDNAAVTYTKKLTLAVSDASYTLYPHTVRYNCSGGSEIDDTVVLDNNSGSSDVILASAPTRDGFIFKGWQIDDTIYPDFYPISVPGDTTVTAVAQWYAGCCDGNIAYMIDTETDTAIAYVFYGSSTDISIPDSVTYDGAACKVITIGENLFAGSYSLVSVTIPSTVTSIGSGAFANCPKLQNVTIPSSVTSIGSGAFEGSSALATVSIPSSVTSIGSCAFRDCTSLTSITVNPENKTYCSVDGVLFNKGMTNLISYPVAKSGSYSIPATVKNVTDYAFYGCKGLTSIYVPSSVTDIGLDAFRGCTKLAKVSVGEGSALNVETGSKENGYLAHYAVDVSSDDVSDPKDDYGTAKTVYSISFGGWRNFEALEGAVYYLPTAEELGMTETSGALIGWQCNGSDTVYPVGTAMTAGTYPADSGTYLSYSAEYYTEDTSLTSKTVYGKTWTKDFNIYLEKGSIIKKSYTIKAVSLAGSESTFEGTVSLDYDKESDDPEHNCKGTAEMYIDRPGTYLITVTAEVKTQWISGKVYDHGIAAGMPHWATYTFSGTYIVTFAVKEHHETVTITLDYSDYNIKNEVLTRYLGETVNLPKAGTGSAPDNLAWWSTLDGYIQYLPGFSFSAEKSMTLKPAIHEDDEGVIAYVFGEGATSDTVKRAYIFDIDGEVTLPINVVRTDDGKTYRLAGWRESNGSVLYLPGTILGKNTGSANTSQKYIEMWAVWILDSDLHYIITFQTAAGYSVSSDYVPYGTEVFVPVYGSVPRWSSDEKCTVCYDAGSTLTADMNLTLTARVKVTVEYGSDVLYTVYPLYGTDFVLDTSLSELNGYSFDVTEKTGIVSDLVIKAYTGSDPVPTPEPETTFLVTYVVDKNATVEYTTKIFNKGDKLVFPKTDLAYCTLSLWQKSGTTVDTETEVTSNMTVTAVFVKLFSTRTDGCTVTVIPAVNGGYSIEWGDGTSEAVLSQDDVSHTYVSGTSGKIAVTFTTGTYAGVSAWARYSAQNGSVTADTIVVKIDGVETTMKAGSKVSDIPISEGNGSFIGWYSDREHTQAVSSDMILVNGTELWSLFEEESVIDFSDPVVIAAIACIAVLGIFAIRRFI